MNRKEILNFIRQNQHLKLDDYHNRLYDKLKDLNQRINRNKLYLGLLIVFYFIGSGSIAPTIQIGPLSINDLSIIYKILPVLYGYIMLELSILSSHKYDVEAALGMVSMALYKQNINIKKTNPHRANLIIRLLMPLSFGAEIAKIAELKSSKFNKVLAIILLLPLLFIWLLPLLFEYLILKELYINYLSGTFATICFLLSIYLALCTLFVFFELSRHKSNEQKKEAINKGLPQM